MTEENFIEKPEGKPVKAFRARVKMYGNDVVVVNPMEPRESNRKMIKQKGKSSFYKSEGEKDSSYSIHINVDANDPDPVATMQERFAELTKGELKSELKLKVKGKMLFESPKDHQAGGDPDNAGLFAYRGKRAAAVAERDGARHRCQLLRDFESV